MISRKACFLLALVCLAMPVLALPNCSVGAVEIARPFAASQTADLPLAGKKTILYIRIAYPDDPAEPISFSDAGQLMTQVSQFYQTHSYGLFTTEATVTPLLQFPAPKADYFPEDDRGNVTWDAWRILGDARAAAAAAGYHHTDYDLDVIRFRAPIIQSYAFIGVRGAWLVSSDLATTIHEIGHNLGLHHANKWNGPPFGPGSNIEYGDAFDVMGNSYYFQEAGLNGLNKLRFGWLSSSNVATVTRNGIYRVYAHDVPRADPSQTYLLRIPKDAERSYWIERRQQLREFEYIENGVLAYWNRWSESNHGTHLLDPTPDPGDALRLRTRLADPEARVQIIPVAQAEDRSWTDVAVILDATVEALSLTLLPSEESDPLLHFSGEPGRTYGIEQSTDLEQWRHQAMLGSPTGEFFLPVATSGPRSFYRTALASAPSD